MTEKKSDTVPALEMRGISKSFGPTVALDNVNFSVALAEVHALVGENGAGKSTLMKILSGVCPADQGAIYLNGNPYQPRNPFDGRQNGIAMIYQELSLAPHMTVAENICLGIESKKYGLLDRKVIRQRAEQALQYFEHPEIKPDLKVADLSVSAQQLVEIARALAMGCKILVLDEPTSSLSKNDTEKLFEVIDMLKDQGISIVYISHFLEEVKQIADRLTVLRDGQVIGTYAVQDVSADDIVTMMVGRNVKDLYPHSERKFGEEILAINDLAGQETPRSVSLTVRRGEVLGIFGLIGAGRTEFLRVLFGLDQIKKGRIRIARFEGPATPHQRWQQGAGMMSENRKEEGLVPGMSIADNITISDLNGFGRFNIIMPGNQKKAVRKWIDRLDIRCHHSQQSINELSGGNQQKAVFARLLQHNVDLFLLDEPTRGIDVGSKAKIYEVIDALACERDQNGKPVRAVLLISSYMPELLGICDRIAVMHKGQLSTVKNVSEVDEHKLMAAATGQTVLA